MPVGTFTRGLLREVSVITYMASSSPRLLEAVGPHLAHEHRHRAAHSNIRQRTASEFDILCADLLGDGDPSALEVPFL